ncbi:MAG: rhomboid family intramembrane serine protease [Candidatus Rokubacteria bacterium]|nr:rhomboid family intramembrane serine protease [Candidatus Rokubacteria bacterium]
MDETDRPIRITPDMLLSRRVDFERRMRRFPPFTMAIIVVLVAVFVGEVLFEALESAEAIVAAGALTREDVEAGQYWRLVTAVFLHGGLEHLVSNAIALFILGMLAEHAFGRAQYFVLFVVSGLAGSLLSVLMNPGPSVGASGAIFGLQAAAVVLFRRHRHRLLVRDRRIGVVMLVWALYSILSGFTSPVIDNGAHIGGAIGGALVARRLHPVVLGPMPAETAERVNRSWWLALGLVAYGVVGWLARLLR